MFSKLHEVESRYEEVNLSLQRPDIASNQTQYRALMKELADLEKIVFPYREFKKKSENLKASKELLRNSFNHPSSWQHQLLSLLCFP